MASNASVPMRRLMTEFKKVRKDMEKGGLPFLLECETVDDNLLKWIVCMNFPEDSELQKSLNTYAEHVLDESQNKLVFQVRFPPEYPHIAPEVWLAKPRLVTATGSQVTFGGKVCLQMLTSSAWNPTASMSTVFMAVHACLLEEGAVVSTSGAVKPYLPPSPVLSRLASDKTPTANNFQVDGMQVLSPFEAAPFFSDVLYRIEAGDKIALSMEHGEKIYSQRGGWVMPIMFEVKTQRGRKFHCGVFDFLAGLPANMVIAPKWVMDEMGIKENDTVRVRGVDLPLIQHVKVQPHSMEFHRAMLESGQDPSVVLCESLRRFSALTEDTAVPIEIGSQVHNMQVLELQPKAAVRIIDNDVVHDFEFKLEIEFAPDLENDEERQAREKELQDRLQARLKEKEKEIEDSKDKREKAIRRHFERARDAAKKEAGDTDGKDGPVTVRLSFHGSPAIDAKFPEGASVAALMACVLTSEWAEQKNPWSVRLLCNFPKRTLTKEDVITKDMHRSVVSVQEELPPSADEEVLEVVELEDQEAAKAEEVATNQPGFFRGLIGRVFSSATEQVETPGIDEAAMEKATVKAFEVQRFIQTGTPEAEARQLVEANVSAPHDRSPVRPPPAPSFMPPQREHDRRPRDETDGKVLRVINFTGCDEAVALRLLETAGGDVQRACNNFFDEMVFS